MSDGSDNFEAQAKREGQILRDHGVRVESQVSPASLGERIPPSSPHTKGPLFPSGQPYIKDVSHPTDTPSANVAASDLQQKPGRSSQPKITPDILSPINSGSGPGRAFTQHEAETQRDAVNTVRSSGRSAQVTAPALAQAETPTTSHALEKGPSSAARDAGSVSSADVTVGNIAAKLKAAQAQERAQEQARTQAPPPQTR